jgi:hypothetical protein
VRGRFTPSLVIPPLENGLFLFKKALAFNPFALTLEHERKTSRMVQVSRLGQYGNP